MRRASLIILSFLFFVPFGWGQNKDPVSSIMELTLIGQVNQGNSYITFPTDIGHIEPLWFEANLSPSFYIRKSKNSRLMGVLTSQVIIRMYQEESFPVRTPSYMPQITAYYLLPSQNKKNTLSFFGKIAHHSNGQDGNFYLENGEINTLSGNFATNYFELGAIKTNFIRRFNAHQFLKTSVEVHSTGLACPELDGQYSTLRWHNTVSFFKLPITEYQNPKEKAKISLKGEATWMFGNVNNWHSISTNRLNLKLTFYYHPRFFEDIGFFVQAYRGMDYYNVYFNHQLRVLRFGIMTEKLRF